MKSLAAKFDHADLKHVETNVKTDVEGELRYIVQRANLAALLMNFRAFDMIYCFFLLFFSGTSNIDV